MIGALSVKGDVTTPTRSPDASASGGPRNPARARRHERCQAVLTRSSPRCGPFMFGATGGSRGVGKAVALALAGGGAAFAVNYRERGEEARAVADAIGSSGGRAAAFAADVSQRVAVESMVRDIEEGLGPSTFWSTTPVCQCRAASKRLQKRTSIAPSQSI
jgi:hypothetical protein